jgi:hypothetical protein
MKSFLVRAMALGVILAVATAIPAWAGSFQALTGPGSSGDEQTSLWYNQATGELKVDKPASKNLTSINIDSAGSRFIGSKPAELSGSFDNFAPNNIFKATFGGSFGAITFGNVLPSGLTQDQVLADLTVVGSLEGGGALGNVDLVFTPVPEPSTVALFGLGLMGLALATRRR